MSSGQMYLAENRAQNFDAVIANASVGAEVGELELDADVFAAKESHDLLKGVAVFADDADGVALDAGLSLLFGVLDGGDDDFGLFRGNALDQFDLLADGGVGGRFRSEERRVGKE